MFVCCWQAYRWEQPPPLSLAKLSLNPAYNKEGPPSTKTQVFFWELFPVWSIILYVAHYEIMGWKLLRNFKKKLWNKPLSLQLQMYPCSFEPCWHLFNGWNKTLDIWSSLFTVMIINSRVHTQLIACTILYMFMHLCVSSEGSRFFLPPLAWPLSLILWR